MKGKKAKYPLNSILMTSKSIFKVAVSEVDTLYRFEVDLAQGGYC